MSRIEGILEGDLRIVNAGVLFFNRALDADQKLHHFL